MKGVQAVVSKGRLRKIKWPLRLPVPRPRRYGGAYLSQVFLHNFWSVVHGKHDVGDAGCREGLDLVQNHALVAELDEGLREG